MMTRPVEQLQESISISQKQSVPTANPYDKFGAGAESKMRLTEGSQQLAAAALREKPVSEARMRAQEQTRYVMPIEQSSARPTEFDRRHAKARPVHSTPASAQPTAKTMAPNPFDDADDAANDYDESKNPFADSVDMASSVTNTKDTKAAEPSTNPFGEFDD